MNNKEIEVFLKKYFLSKGIKNISKIKNNNLISGGIMDSLDIVTLIVEIKKKFNINININSSKTLEAFSTYNSLKSFIKKNK